MMDDQKNKLIHVLKPILVGESSYQQFVEVVIDSQGQKKLLIRTQNAFE